MSVNEVIPFISTGIAVTSLLYTLWHTSKQSTTALEHRITALENNQFIPSDRECLHEVDLKMKLFWGIVEKEFPKILHSEHTPKIDILLEKAMTGGVSKLSEDERNQLLTHLKKERRIALKESDKSRAIATAFYEAILKYNGDRRT
jgi:hypothetical protein